MVIPRLADPDPHGSGSASLGIRQYAHGSVHLWLAALATLPEARNYRLCLAPPSWRATFLCPAIDQPSAHLPADFAADVACADNLAGAAPMPISNAAIERRIRPPDSFLSISPICRERGALSVQGQPCTSNARREEKCRHLIRYRDKTHVISIH